jgi:hypothetical protein
MPTRPLPDSVLLDLDTAPTELDEVFEGYHQDYISAADWTTRDFIHADTDDSLHYVLQTPDSDHVLQTPEDHDRDDYTNTLQVAPPGAQVLKLRLHPTDLAVLDNLAVAPADQNGNTAAWAYLRPEVAEFRRKLLLCAPATGLTTPVNHIKYQFFL